MVTLRAAGVEPTAGEAEIEEFGRGERLLRATGDVAGAWLLAFVFLFVPIAQFVLVPILLAGGLWRAARRLKSTTRLARAWGRCPHCGRQANFLRGGEGGLEGRLRCGDCRRELVLELSLLPS